MSAPVFDANGAGVPIAAASVTYSHTVGGGTNTALHVGVHWGVPGKTVVSVSFNGVDFAGAGAPSGKVVGTFKEQAGQGGTEQWLLVNPAAGTHNVVATISASGNMNAGSNSWSSVHQTAPTSNPNTNGAASSTTPSIAITANVDDIAVGGCSGIAVGNYTTTSTQSYTTNSVGTFGFAGAYGTGGGAPLTLNWAGGFAGSGWASSGFALKPLAAGGAVQELSLMTQGAGI